MKNIISLAIGILIFLGGVFAAHGQEPLSKDDIQHFMDAMRPLQELGQKYDFGTTGGMSADGMDVMDFFPMSRALERVKDHESYCEFLVVIQDVGFSSPGKWANIGDRIMRAYMFGKLVEKLGPEKIQGIEKNIAEIEKNKYLSGEIKKKMLDNLKQILVMANEMPQDIKADQESLKHFSVRLKRLFEEQ